MNKNIKSFLLVLCVVLILFFFLIIVNKSKTRIVSVEYAKLNTVLSKKDYSLVFIGSLSNEQKKFLQDLKNQFNIQLIELQISSSELEDLKWQNDELEMSDIRYLIYAEDNLEVMLDEDTSDERLIEKLNQVINGIIPEDERYYQVLYSSKDYQKKVNSNKYTIAVFGDNDCTYCKFYLPVFNKAAKDYGLDIYYFNESEYDTDEYEKVLALDLEIPGECTKDKIPTSLSKDFDYPMTIITKSGKVVGCIRGYVTEEKLIQKFIDTKVLKEK